MILTNDAIPILDMHFRVNSDAALDAKLQSCGCRVANEMFDANNAHGDSVALAAADAISATSLFNMDRVIIDAIA